MTQTAPPEHGLTDDRVALVFPGQGSQRPAMASPWRRDPAFARWGEADEILGRDVTRLGLEASADELRDPRSCQIALFVHHAVLWEAWSRAGGDAAVVAGHSLGEYNALVAAGVLRFDDALRLVAARAQATGAAADQRPGGMVACLGCDMAAVTRAAEATGIHLANDNADGQVVVAGDADALEQFAAAMASSRGRVVALEVGAAYHSPHMQPAVEPFSAALAYATFADATVPVVANVDAQPHVAAAQWPELLRRQLVTPVRWRETVQTVAGLAVTNVVELGASAVLTSLVKRIDPALQRAAVREPGDVAVTA